MPPPLEKPPEQAGTVVRPARRVGDWSREINSRNGSSGWRMLVSTKLESLQADIDCTGSVPPCVPGAMEIAGNATKGRSWPSYWYSGANIERAWRAIHVAEIWLLSTRPDLGSRMPAIRAKVASKLTADDQRCTSLAPKNFDALDAEGKQAAVREALRATYQTSDDAEVAVRSLRNRIMLFGLLLLALNVVIGWFAALHPHLLALCGPESKIATCASRPGQDPSGGDVLWLQLFGMLGAAIAVVILLQRTKPSVVVYSVAPYQAAVKVLMGAVFALIGVLVLGTGVLVSTITTRPALLLFAVVLGYSQEFGTRILDRYADRVVQTAQPTANPSEAARAT
jgi:hypothetical protein